MTKYRAKRTEIDGHTFASKAEAKRYGELKLMLRANEIEDLRVHPRYPLKIGAAHICDYVADFSYIDRRTGDVVTEDVKGFKTPVYRLKRKIFQAVTGREITEVYV